MALVVGTDSLASVAEADAWIESVHGTADFFETRGDGESLLRAATRDLVDLVDYHGMPTDEHQALPFPRKYLKTRNGAALDSATIPEEMKRACAEQAYRSADRDPRKEQRLSDLDIRGAGGATFGGGAFRRVLYSAALDLIPRDWIRRVWQGNRGSFPIARS